jgi:Ca-activated chloride channel family protein
MTDDDIYAKILREETPIAPRQAARDMAIAKAMQRFAEENSRKPQGSSILARLTARVGQFLERRHFMTTIRFNHVALGGASFAALALAVTISVPLVRQNFDREGGATVATPPIEEVAKKETPETRLRQQEAEAVAPPANVPDESADAAIAEQNALPLQLPRDAGDIAAKPEAKAKLSAERMIAGSPPVTTVDMQYQGYRDQGRDKFSEIKTNPVKVTAEEPVSTFSIDVDTASYSFVRGSLNENVLPQKDAVRVEELINYFPYDYAGSSDRAQPFKATASLMPTPWNPDTRLLHIGIKGFALNGQEKPKSNLVFLLDTSGSMEEPNKLPLLVNSMKMLVDTLGPEDSVAIVTYAGNAGTLLQPTKGKDKAKILAALDGLMAGGSTAGAEGIRQAYRLAELNFDKTGINRVILATDGDFNVGIADPDELKSFVERKRETGVFLSVLGFGRGNYNDELMQTLAQNGNGNASYIDTLNEARKVLVDEAASTLFPIAKDVKIQVEFNPARVQEYRLIGYETRMLAREDFNNDKVDAGEIGAGHTVTAIYEVVPKGKSGLVDPLKYAPAETAGGASGEWATVKIRYKLPNETASKLVEQPVGEASAAPSSEAKFAASVAAFGQLLRGGQYTKAFTYDDVIALAQANKGADPFGYRAEFINLVRIAKTAQGMEPLKP